jgi:DNA polymerase-4/DNA polymerase V
MPTPQHPAIISNWPQAILHIDADAFFASCEQAMHPEWKGRPVITGQERGIVSAASYEAKRAGVDRGTPLWEVKKICPDAIIVPSDYESYALFSARMFEIVRRFTNDVEEYSIDEAFADITGLRRPLHGSYESIARRIKETVDQELGITVSVGVAPSKTLAKVASKWNKPSGCTIMPGRHIRNYLAELPIGKVWGIGSQTAAWCHNLRIKTALAFADKSEEFIVANFTKPHQETWKELNGRKVFRIVTEPKTGYATISKTETFTPPSRDRDFVLAQLMKNLENACTKARRHSLAAKGVTISLKTQDFSHTAKDIVLAVPSAHPKMMTNAILRAYENIHRAHLAYRATSIVLTGLTKDSGRQLSLFESSDQSDKLKRLYHAIDAVCAKLGKHAVHLASSTPAHNRDERMNRGKKADRKFNRLLGETPRKRISVPVLDYKLT